MSYEIKLSNFSGPFDLLLHLISESKLDLLELQLSELTIQYLQYIKNSSELDFEEASEYLVMAAQLLNMKTKILLPVEKNEALDYEYDKNSPEELIKRLMEYKKIRGRIDDLQVAEENRFALLKKLESSMVEFIDKEEKIENDGSQQISLLEQLLNRALERKRISKEITAKITKDEVSFEIVQEQVHQKLNTSQEEFEFEEFLPVWDKKYIVTLFFVLLSLTAKQEIHIIQDDNFGRIYIKKGAFSA